MILAFDTYYFEDKARTVALQFENWNDEEESLIFDETLSGISEYVSGEFYKPGDRIKVYVKSVEYKAKGPEILLSRTSEEILKKIFYLAF